MLDLLAKIFGPSRAVSVYIAGKRFGIPVLLLAAFGVALWVMFSTTSTDKYEHVAYVEVAVLGTTPLTTSDANAGVFVDVRMPDGSELKLTETEGAISRSLTERACVEQRRNTTTGEMDHRLRLPHRCGF